VAIVYNGEVYNFRNLRTQLGPHTLRTQSDTEVILEGYLRHGINFFQRLRGIYAFAILDRRNDGTRLVLGRDPVGVKPLYFTDSENEIVFGSEIKAVKAASETSLSWSETALKHFLHFSYVPEPLTAWNEIQALRPGHILVWEEGKGTQSIPFFKFDFEPGGKKNYSTLLEETEARIQTAVTRNLEADVDVSLALSGGIDSSLVYHVAHRVQPEIQALSVSFARDPRYDESPLIRQIVDTIGGKHHMLEPTSKVDLDLVHSVFEHFDQPYADSSAIPVFLLNQAARAFGKVLIGGDGGDELFNGYPSQTFLAYTAPILQFPGIASCIRFAQAVSRGGLSRKLDRTAGLVKGGKSLFHILYNRNAWFPPTLTHDGKPVFQYDYQELVESYGSLFADEVPASRENTIVFDYFRKTMLSDYLRKTDMMAMRHGVEWRVPLLDEDLAVFAFKIPFFSKSDLFTTKKILRDLHKKVYPKNISKAPKSGFGIPMDIYLTREEKKKMCEVVGNGECVFAGWIDKTYLEFLIRSFLGKGDSTKISRGAVYQRMLILYNLQRWAMNN
ncbi:MAG: asparagine synthase (glutamine-hydrolyzing), partial [Gammaproteobacteria bacterium]